MGEVFASAPLIVGKSEPSPTDSHSPAEEALCPVVANDWVNEDYKHLVLVASARWAIRTAGAALAMPGMLWCSATQCRWKPRRSTVRDRSTELRSASPADEPSATGARSSTDSTGIARCNPAGPRDVPRDCGRGWAAPSWGRPAQRR